MAYDTHFRKPLFTHKPKMMNTDNLANLYDTLKYQGVGDKVNEQLEKAIRNEVKEIKLTASFSHELPVSIKDDPLTKDRLTHEFNFKQGKNGLNYFNSYQAKLESPLFQDRRCSTWTTDAPIPPRRSTTCCPGVPCTRSWNPMKATATRPSCSWISRGAETQRELSHEILP